ncbi:MAG: 16S rRNA (uracil(1498)-N(3))-methyltransferase [Hyphomicrobiaceae bacterium]
MAVHDFTSQRLFVTAALHPGAEIALDHGQTNYLRNVLRLGSGDILLAFNGRDGEWRCEIAERGKRQAALVAVGQVRPQEAGPDITYLFAPLKRARLDYMVQKATEMGVARLAPVITQRTIAERINLERMQANVIEAAEQCGVLRVPEVAEPVKLAQALASWPADRPLVFCDEAAPLASPIEALRGVEPGPAGVLVGPEGGFSEDERRMIRAVPGTVAVSLGPRVMRADTAAVAVLALVNVTLGDWR